MNVYVVVRVDDFCQETDVVRVFASREAAEVWISKQPAQGDIDYEIEEHLVCHFADGLR